MTTEPNHLDEWQPLSIRYGRGKWGDPVWADKSPWGQRHRSARIDANAQPHQWCICPGCRNDTPCAMKATQEDGLCDECRQWCIAVDREGNHHQLASLR